MNLPDDAASGNRSNNLDFNRPGVKMYNEQGNINQKFARSPRVPQIQRSVDGNNINMSSTMPYNSGYYGVEPLPEYVKLYGCK